MAALLRAFVLAATLLTVPAAAGIAKPTGDQTLSAALRGSPIMVLDPNSNRETRRGTISKADFQDRCTLRLSFEEEGQSETVPLGELHFVQGDGFSVDIASRLPQRSEYIIQVGEDRYSGTMRLLTARAESCGAKLVGPPPLVTTVD